jgi:hypothetical protein
MKESRSYSTGTALLVYLVSCLCGFAAVPTNTQAQAVASPEIWVGPANGTVANGTVVFSAPQALGCVPSVATTSKTFSVSNIQLQVTGSLLTPGSFTATLTETTFSNPTPGVQVTCYDSQGNITASFMVLANPGGSEAGTFTITGTSDGQQVTANFVNMVNGRFGRITGTIQNTTPTTPPQLLLKIMTSTSGTTEARSDTATATLTLQQQLSIKLTLDPSKTEPNRVHYGDTAQNDRRVTATAEVTDQNGQLVQSAEQVDFSIIPDAVGMLNSGHAHSNTDDLSHFLIVVDENGNPFVSATSCMTGGSDGPGRCHVEWIIDNVSGVFDMPAKLHSDPTIQDIENVTVSLDGLKSLPDTGAGYVSVGQFGTDSVTSQHYRNHFGTPLLVGKVENIASVYFFNMGRNASKTLQINDMSLPQGGLFDIGNDWLAPHFLHRDGSSVDINRTHTDGSAVDLKLLTNLAWVLGMCPAPELPKIHFDLEILGCR